MKIIVLLGLVYLSYRLFLAPKSKNLDKNGNEIEYIDYEEIEKND